MLPWQGSNLKSSHPECDVLPITPHGNVVVVAGFKPAAFGAKIRRSIQLSYTTICAPDRNRTCTPEGTTS